MKISLVVFISCALTEILQIVTDASNGCASGFLDSGVEGSFLRRWQVMFETCRLFFLLFTGLIGWVIWRVIGRVISRSTLDLRQVQCKERPGDICLVFTEIWGQRIILCGEITMIHILLIVICSDRIFIREAFGNFVVILDRNVADFCFSWHSGGIKSLTFRFFNIHWLNCQNEILIHLVGRVTELSASNFYPINAKRKVIRCPFNRIKVLRDIIKHQEWRVIIMLLIPLVRHHQTHISVDNTVLSWERWNDIDRVPFILILERIIINKGEDRLCALLQRGLHDCLKATVLEWFLWIQ